MRTSTQIFSILCIAGSSVALFIYLHRKRYIEIQQEDSEIEDKSEKDEVYEDAADDTNASIPSIQSSSHNSLAESFLSFSSDDTFVKDVTTSTSLSNISDTESENSFQNTRRQNSKALRRNSDFLEKDKDSFEKQISSPVISTLRTNSESRKYQMDSNNDSITHAQEIVRRYGSEPSNLQEGSQMDDFIQDFLRTYSHSNTPNSPNTQKCIVVDTSS